MNDCIKGSSLGLLVELIQQVDSGRVPAEVIEWIITRRPGYFISDFPLLQEKFKLKQVIGTIVVPDNYSTPDLAELGCGFRREDFDDEATTEAFMHNLLHSSRDLFPGEKYRVLAFSQVVSEETTLKMQLEFLKAQGASFLGNQAIPLVLKQNPSAFTPGLTYMSLGKPEKFQEDAYGYHRTLCIDCDKSGVVRLRLGRLEHLSSDSDTLFLGFFETNS